MIKYNICQNSSISIEQCTVKPSVYLDHWALRNISEDNKLRDELVKILKDKNGTLMLSKLNLLEFTQVKDIEQGQAAEALIESILPNIFFIEIDPFMVIENEDQLLNGALPFPPHADMELFKSFTQLKNDSPSPFTARELFTAFQKSDLIVDFNSLADVVVEEINTNRKSISNNIDLAKRIRKVSSGSNIQRGTRYIFRELARSILLDQSTIITRNHAIDLLHSVVPIAYCDYVLLDKYWVPQVDQLRRRFKKKQMPISLANVYSKKNNGILNFFHILNMSI